MGPEGISGLRAFEVSPGATGGPYAAAILDCPICGVGAELTKPSTVSELLGLLSVRLQALVLHYNEAHPEVVAERLLSDWETQHRALVAWADPERSAQSS